MTQRMQVIPWKSGALALRKAQLMAGFSPCGRGFCCRLRRMELTIGT
jgi:hypothetical protein